MQEPDSPERRSACFAPMRHLAIGWTQCTRMVTSTLHETHEISVPRLMTSLQPCLPLKHTPNKCHNLHSTCATLLLTGLGDLVVLEFI